MNYPSGIAKNKDAFVKEKYTKNNAVKVMPTLAILIPTNAHCNEKRELI